MSISKRTAGIAGAAAAVVVAAAAVLTRTPSAPQAVAVSVSATPVATAANLRTEIARHDARLSALETALAVPTSPPTPSATPAYTSTPTRTATPSPAAPTATQAVTTAPSSTTTPMATVPPASVPSLTVSVIGIAKPGQYIEFALDYSGPAAEVGLQLPERTAFYADQRPLVPPSECTGPPGVRWCTAGALQARAFVYVFSTARVGDVLTFVGYVQLPEERLTLSVPVLVGGGTPQPTGTPTRTPAPTAPPVAVLVLRSLEWTQIDNPSGAAYLYIWTPWPILDGPCDANWNPIYGFWNTWGTGCLGAPTRLWMTDGSFHLRRWENLWYGWHRLQTDGHRVLWLYLSAWERGGTLPVYAVRLSDYPCDTSKCMGEL